MTYNDLLDQLAYDADDQSSAFRTAALRWLNLGRAYIARKTRWRTAFRPSATFTTSNGASVYSLVDGSSVVYEHVSGDILWDQTNNLPIKHESYEALNSADPDRSVTATPYAWADAGMDSSGRRQIYLWPIPNGTYTIRFAGYIRLSDVTSAILANTEDSYFGSITPWAETFVEAMQFFHYKNTNEDLAQISAQQLILDNSIKLQQRVNDAAPDATMGMRVVRTTMPQTLGRFDPSHYNNRG